MSFINTKEKILCSECGHVNEILTLEAYTSGRSVQGSVSGTRYHKDEIPVRIISDGKCKECGKSIREDILEEFPGGKFLK